MSELRGLGEVNAELTRRGGRLFAVSADPPAEARRVVEGNGLDFAILCDTGGEVIESYRVVHRGGGPGGGDIPVPALVLIDRNGLIVWTRVAARIQDRPRPDEVLAAVKGLDAVTN